MSNNQTDTELTIEKFMELFGKSNAAGLLPIEMKMAIDKAIAEKDMSTLKNIYDILLQEQASERNIAREFNDAKNRIVDNFMVAATDVRKKYVEAPMKEKIAAAASEEKAAAEGLLKKL
jgi:hypothetical protein